jgi:TonB family protein
VREGVRGFACIRFVIERDGSISEIVKVRPSKVRPFNRAATAAIRATISLPPLPDDFPHPREGVTGCFFYNMHPSEAGSE